MKPLTLLLLLIISTSLFAQQMASFVRTDYLQKSKNQKKTALIMLGGGSGLLLTGLIIPHGKVTHEGFWDTYQNTGVKLGFVAVGLASMLGSIPFFISASKNKKKASLGFKIEESPDLTSFGLTDPSFPGLPPKKMGIPLAIPSFSIKIPL